MNRDISTPESEADIKPPVSVVPMQHAAKRVILTMGGKGGVGKTSFMLSLAEWFASKEITLKLLPRHREQDSWQPFSLLRQSCQEGEHPHRCRPRFIH